MGVMGVVDCCTIFLPLRFAFRFAHCRFPHAAYFRSLSTRFCFLRFRFRPVLTVLRILLGRKIFLTFVR